MKSWLRYLGIRFGIPGGGHNYCRRENRVLKTCPLGPDYEACPVRNDCLAIRQVRIPPGKRSIGAARSTA